ncbi:hypothetical protein D9M69_638640 [compost metagenome]
MAVGQPLVGPHLLPGDRGQQQAALVFWRELLAQQTAGAAAQAGFRVQVAKRQRFDVLARLQAAGHGPGVRTHIGARGRVHVGLVERRDVHRQRGIEHLLGHLRRRCRTSCKTRQSLCDQNRFGMLEVFHGISLVD